MAASDIVNPVEPAQPRQHPSMVRMATATPTPRPYQPLPAKTPTTLSATGVPHSHRYTLTDDGARITIMNTKIYNRMLVPLTAADQPQAPPELQAALRTISRHVDAYATRARLPRPAQS